MNTGDCTVTQASFVAKMSGLQIVGGSPFRLMHLPPSFEIGSTTSLCSTNGMMATSCRRTRMRRRLIPHHAWGLQGERLKLSFFKFFLRVTKSVPSKNHNVLVNLDGYQRRNYFEKDAQPKNGIYISTRVAAHSKSMHAIPNASTNQPSPRPIVRSTPKHCLSSTASTTSTSRCIFSTVRAGARTHSRPAWWRVIGDTDLRLISNIRLCFPDESTKKAGTNRHDFSVVCAKTASRPTISTTVFGRSTKTIDQWREHGESEAKPAGDDSVRGG